MKIKNLKCPSCGASVFNRDKQEFVVCEYCETQIHIVKDEIEVEKKESVSQSDDNQSSTKSWVVTIILCWMLGMFGVHRFYIGRPISGIFMLMTFGGFGFWMLIDLFIIILGRFKDGDGNLIAR